MGVQVREELDEKEKFIGELVYRYLTIFQFNCHAIVQSDQDSDYDFIGGYVIHTAHPHPPPPLLGISRQIVFYTNPWKM